jgi:hypothetical protein
MSNAKPCVGSGFCCSKAICFEGQRKLGKAITPCPLLRWDGKRHKCGLLEDATPEDAATLKDSLAIGAGCCMPLFNTWRQDLKDRTKQ